jgi:D-xylonolactonase
MTRPQNAADIACEVGEGPLWHADEEVVYWCDIPQGRLYRYDPAAGDHELVYEDEDERIGGYTIQRDGSLLLFQEAGAVRRLDQETGSVATVAGPDPDRFHERFNDVVADPEGRVFAGVMPDHERDLPGQLYRLDTDGSFELVREECGLPNGMDFTPDLSSMYFTDTGEDVPDHPGYIYRYDYDRATGAISDPELFVDATDVDGMPDGLSVDTDGGVWSAFWLGGTVIRFDPDGDRDRTVEFTARRTTAVTFGGDDYGTGYVTSGCLDSREVDGEGAGSLFTFDPGATGREEFRSDVEV